MCISKGVFYETVIEILKRLFKHTEHSQKKEHRPCFKDSATEASSFTLPWSGDKHQKKT